MDPISYGELDGSSEASDPMDVHNELDIYNEWDYIVYSDWDIRDDARKISRISQTDDETTRRDLRNSSRKFYVFTMAARNDVGDTNAIDWIYDGSPKGLNTVCRYDAVMNADNEGWNVGIRHARIDGGDVAAPLTPKGILLVLPRN